jgi:histidinol-phosphatase (PHP family)
MERGLEEIWLLEHTHIFTEFTPMYEEISHYSEYQKEWALRRIGKRPLQEYTEFIRAARQLSYPIKLRFGLEVCYFEENEKLIGELIRSFPFDFTVGSVHWIDGFGFDHKAELWNGHDVDRLYRRYYEIMKKLISSCLFTGVAHPDSIKVFGYRPSYDLSEIYHEIARLLKLHDMYAEQSGGLCLNYSKWCELGMNSRLREILVTQDVRIQTASDAHSPENVGAYISELHKLISG